MALTGLEAGRSVSGISCSQERRLPGYPSRTWEYKSFKEWRSPGWRLEDLAPRRGAHRVGGWKIGDPRLKEEKRIPKALASENDPRPGGIEPAVSKLRSCRASSN